MAETSPERFVGKWEIWCGGAFLALVSAGAGFMSLGGGLPVDYWLARACFLLAWVPALIALVHRCIVKPRTTGRLISSAIALAIVVLISVATMKWVSLHEQRSAPASNTATGKEEQPPPAKAPIADPWKPNLQGQIGQFMVAPGKRKNKDTVLTLDVTLINTGAPSFAGSFGFKLRLKDGRTIDGELSCAGVATMTGPHMSKQKLLLSNCLPYAAPRQQIATNGTMFGFVMVALSGVTPREVEDLGSTLLLSFRDARGTESIVEGHPKGDAHLPPGPKDLQPWNPLNK